MPHSTRLHTSGLHTTLYSLDEDLRVKMNRLHGMKCGMLAIANMLLSEAHLTIHVPAKLQQCVAVHVVTDVDDKLLREIVEQVLLAGYRHHPWAFGRFGVHCGLQLVPTSLSGSCCYSTLLSDPVDHLHCPSPTKLVHLFKKDCSSEILYFKDRELRATK